MVILTESDCAVVVLEALVWPILGCGLKAACPTARSQELALHVGISMKRDDGFVEDDGLLSGMRISELQSYLADEADADSSAGYEHRFFLDLRLPSTVGDFEQGEIFYSSPFRRKSLP